ncbi:MAG: BlaI/MecI/CopY family transcriptional regulator [Lachnospiraceae bacterium]|nr:BlaI/MecI/CopY family transcriptional regulator [Lachnospiraceae bacterium]
MAENFSFELTKRAMDIMNILWDADKPLAASDFLAYDSTLTLHTVHAYLKKLLKNNFIEVDKIIMSGKNLTRCYKPSLSRNEFQTQKFLNTLDYEQISVANLVSSFFEHSKDEVRELREISELEQLIKDKKQKLKDKFDQ